MNYKHIIFYFFSGLILFNCDLLDNSEKFYGCMDSAACNYDAAATAECTADLISDGLCESNCKTGDGCIPYETNYQMSSTHLEKTFNVCYGGDMGAEVTLGNYEGQVVWLQAVASW